MLKGNNVQNIFSGTKMLQRVNTLAKVNFLTTAYFLEKPIKTEPPAEKTFSNAERKHNNEENDNSEASTMSASNQCWNNFDVYHCYPKTRSGLQEGECENFELKYLDNTILHSTNQDYWNYQILFNKKNRLFQHFYTM